MSLDERLANAMSMNAPVGGDVWVDSERMSDLDVAAMGTYCHELVHWWQYLGTTAGFALGLATANKGLAGLDKLNKISRASTLWKPLIQQRDDNYRGVTRSSDRDLLTYLLNDWSDLYFATMLVLHPSESDGIRRSAHFVSPGHSIFMLLSVVNELLRATLMSDCSDFPDANTWWDDYKSAVGRFRDFDEDATMRMPALGGTEILEGQARMSECQYLAQDGEDFDSLRRRGLMGAVYTRALEMFIKLTGAQTPSTPLSPVIDMFLLVCDIACNPSVGYPLDIGDCDRLCRDFMMGWRFLAACDWLRKHKSAINAVKRSDRNEYVQLSGDLCHGCSWEPPHALFERIRRYHVAVEGHPRLRIEHGGADVVDFSLVGLLTSRHFSLVTDKLSTPEVFVWPGRYLIFRRGDHRVAEVVRLREKHVPINFSKGLNARAQYIAPLDMPVQHRGKVMAAYMEHYLVSDLFEQLVENYGEFAPDYVWFDPNGDRRDYQDLCDEMIRTHFGRGVSDFRVYEMPRS